MRRDDERGPNGNGVRGHRAGADGAMTDRSTGERAEGGRPETGVRAGLPFAMVITDPNLPDNPIVYVNKAFERITQYTADYAIGRNCRFLQGEETAKQDVETIRRAIQRNEDVSVDIVNYRADGTPFNNRLLIAPLPDGDGKVANHLGIQRMVPADGSGPRREDDPAQREAEELAYAARSGTDQGVFGLDTIRSSIENHIGLIVSLVRLREGDDIKTLAPRMLGRRIESLQLLYEELDQAGVASVRDETVPVGAYLSRVAATLTHLEGRRSVRVNVDCDTAELPVAAAARLGLLLSEFLLNSLRHAFPERRDGLINVEFKTLTDDRARLMVKDDGVGMGSEDDWPFTRDERAEDAQEARTGHRVGAKLVRQLVDTLDAAIDVMSDRFGTTVEVGMSLAEMRAETSVPVE